MSVMSEERRRTWQSVEVDLPRNISVEDIELGRTERARWYASCGSVWIRGDGARGAICASEPPPFGFFADERSRPPQESRVRSLVPLAVAGAGVGYVLQGSKGAVYGALAGALLSAMGRS